MNEESYEVTADDRDERNVRIRAGYLLGLATRGGLNEEDRVFLHRAVRSLLAFADALEGKAP